MNWYNPYIVSHLQLDSIKKNIDYIAVYNTELSINPNITWDFIQANPNISWKYQLLSYHHNITMDIINANSKKPWNPEYIASNPNVSWDIIRKHYEIGKNKPEKDESSDDENDIVNDYDQDENSPRPVILSQFSTFISSNFTSISKKLKKKSKKKKICGFSVNCSLNLDANPLSVLRNHPSPLTRYLFMNFAKNQLKYNPLIYKKYSSQYISNSIFTIQNLTTYIKNYVQ